MKTLTITVIVCAYNESRLLPACLFSLLAQTRPPDEILVVDNASTDGTGAVARAIHGVVVVDEPRKGLVVAREAARRAATGDVLAYVDADCRVPLQWLERVEARFAARDGLVGVTGPYRFYDWDWSGRALVRAYDIVVAPATHAFVHHALGIGSILYGGNFAVRRDALDCIGGSTAASSFMERTRTSAAGRRRTGRSRCGRTAGSGPRRDAIARWASARSSDCTCAISGRRSCVIVRPIANI